MADMKFAVKEGGCYDVIVIGGGPAGCAASIASAREHKSTLLIEGTGALGGMGTMGLVPAWCPFSDQEKMVYRGIAEKIFNRSKEYVANVPKERLDWVGINPEALKRIYDEEVSGAGVQVLFLSQVVSAVVKEGKTEAVVVANKAGLTVFWAKVFVDATGDGDVAVLSGAAYEAGRDGKHLQSATHCFSIANVDSFGYEHVLGDRMGNGDPKLIRNGGQQELICAKLYHAPELDMIQDTHFCNNMFAAGTVGFNAGHLEAVDPLDPFQVSDKLMQGRRLAHQFEVGLRKYAPEAFGNAWLAQTGPLLGIRESRRIVCDYMLTLQDYLERKSFADEIGRSCYYVDVHRSREEKEKGNTREYERYKPGESQGIPYRCLLPKGIENLLVAGRCIGSDSLVNGAIRVMPPCLVTGEAAGTAAAMAAEADGLTRNIDVGRLMEKLEGYGAYLHRE